MCPVYLGGAFYFAEHAGSGEDEEGRSEGGGPEEAFSLEVGGFGGVGGVVRVGDQGTERGVGAIERSREVRGVAVGFGGHAGASAEVEGERGGGVGLIAKGAAAHFKDGAVEDLISVLDDDAQLGAMLEVRAEREGQSGMLGIHAAGDGFGGGCWFAGTDLHSSDGDVGAGGDRGLKTESLDRNVRGQVGVVVEAAVGVDFAWLEGRMGAGVAIAGGMGEWTRLQGGDDRGCVEGAVVGWGDAGVEGAGVVAFFDGVGEFEAVLEEAEVAKGGCGVGEGGGVKQDAGLGSGRGWRRSDGTLPVEAAGGQAGGREKEREDGGGWAHASVVRL